MDIDIRAAEVQYVGVESFLASFENVTGWTYSASGKDAIIVGLRTDPMFSLTARRAFFDDVREGLLAMGYARAEVTDDADLVYEIGKTGHEADPGAVNALCDSAARRRK